MRARGGAVPPGPFDFWTCRFAFWKPIQLFLSITRRVARRASRKNAPAAAPRLVSALLKEKRPRLSSAGAPWRAAGPADAATRRPLLAD